MTKALSGLAGLRLSSFEGGGAAALGDLLSDRDLRAALYPEMRCPPSVDWAVAHWLALPSGADDLQLAVGLSDDPMIGCVRLENRMLSYFIGRRHWGHGYGHAAVAMLMGGVLRTRDAAVLSAFVDRSNLASRRILEKNGFAFSGFRAGHASAKRLLGYSCRAGQRGPATPTVQVRADASRAGRP